MTGQLAVPRILWAALFVSTLLYVAVLELTIVSGQPDWQVLFPPLASAGAIVGGGSLVAPRVFLWQRSAKATKESSSTEAAGGYLDRDALG